MAALGDIEVQVHNRRKRFIEMNEFKPCPYETEAQFGGMPAEEAANFRKKGKANSTATAKKENRNSKHVAEENSANS